jgi:hypothetical protein
MQRFVWAASVVLAFGCHGKESSSAAGSAASPPPPAPQPVATPDAAVSVTPPLEKVAPKPLAGPFTDLAAYCATQPTENRGGEKLACNTGKLDATGPLRLDATPPYKDVKIFPAPNGCTIGIATDAGWFVPEDWNLGCTWPTVIDELVVREGVLVARWHATDTGVVSEKRVVSERESLVACGIGASGKPSCTPPIPVRLAEVRKGAPHFEAKLDVTIGAGPTIDIAGDLAAMKSPATTANDAADVIGKDTGKHALVFP